MSLNNLLKIGQLVELKASAEDCRQLLKSACRAVKDSENIHVSVETRFDAAYRAIMQAATAALWANGYRPSTSVPGHHRTTLQSLVHTIGLDAARIAVLDRLRHKRNLADYSGEDIDEHSLLTCVNEAKSLLEQVERWVTFNPSRKD